MTPFAEESLGEVLEQLAAGRPAPAGGSAAAWACAMAAALVGLAADIGGLGELRDRAALLRADALALADRDAAAFGALLAARRGGDAAAALDEAADAPLAVVRTAAEVAALGVRAGAEGKPATRGDAVTGVLLAEAAARAAALLVEINLAARDGDPRPARARELAGAAARSRDEVLGG